MSIIKTDLVSLLSELVKIKSIDKEGNISALEEVADFVENRLKNLKGVYVKRLIIEKKPSLIVTFKKDQKNPKVFFNGHMDVMPADENQFSPFIKGGKLFARGAQDMKGGVAVMIALIEHFAKANKKPDIGFMFVTDEEAHGTQSKTFLKTGYRPKLLVTVEPTDLNLVIETKGMLWMEGFIQGKSAHGSSPWLGRNPVVDFQKGLAKFYKKFPPLKKFKWIKTLNIGEVKAGDSYNTVPRELSFKLDVRYLAKDNPKKLVKEIQKCFPSDTKWIINRMDPPHTKAKDMSLIKLLKKSAEDLKMPTKYDRANYCTDARFFAAAGISCAVIGTKGKNIHAKDEYVEIESVKNVFEILKGFCERL